MTFLDKMNYDDDDDDYDDDDFAMLSDFNNGDDRYSYEYNKNKKIA